MRSTQPQSLWRWICVRVLALAISSVVLIALCMWLSYGILNFWIISHMSPEMRAEFALLRDQPELNPARFHQIVDQGWGLRYSEPTIATSDWAMVGILVLIVIPFIIVLGLRAARPLSAQVSQLANAAGAVARGEFGTRAVVAEKVPMELIRLTEDFNVMTQQLERYDRELRASHVAMAHELRSPLTAAMGRLQGMIDGVFAAEPQQLQMVMKQLQYLSRLSDELLLLSLADAGQLKLSKSATNLTDILHERVIWLKPQATAADMAITVIAPAQCRYTGDPFRLGQVFTILMENALRYAAEGGRLVIDIAKNDRGHEITFRDYGPGVPTEFLPTIFERFTRADSSRARHSGGCGLGLSIARAICQAHGGTIKATQPENGGLLISIFLPSFLPSSL